MTTPIERGFLIGKWASEACLALVATTGTYWSPGICGESLIIVSIQKGFKLKTRGMKLSDISLWLNNLVVEEARKASDTIEQRKEE